MRLFVDYTLSGVSAGMVYAAVALGLVLIWRSTQILNFAQGAMAMLTTYVASTLLEHSFGYWAAFALALVAGLVLGAATERVLIRPVEGRSAIDAVIVAIGLLIFLEALAGAIWGSNPRAFPAPFKLVGYVIGGQPVEFTPFDLFIVLAVLLLMGLMLVLFRFTGVGLRMRASAFAPEVARLLGVRVNRMLTLGWALAAMAGALAGVFVAPKVFLSPTYMDSILIYGFTAAIVGGLESPVGSLVGGLGTGLILSYVGGYLGSSFQATGALVLLVVVLMVRPTGLFSRVQPRRV
ncbi:MAG TPA: branched-chain amino acid ABC transporter permease [Acidimicrobiales bacterium]|nr:branched-chain amino acid ABC transporter permease [Acidimicrobiales bacterium]